METALVKVSNNLLLTTDQGDCPVLVLFCLSATFDTFHQSFFLCLKTWVGLKETTLYHRHSHINKPSQRPFLLLLILIQNNNVSHHFYVDDTHLYIPPQSSNYIGQWQRGPTGLMLQFLTLWNGNKCPLTLEINTKKLNPLLITIIIIYDCIYYTVLYVVYIHVVILWTTL